MSHHNSHLVHGQPGRIPSRSPIGDLSKYGTRRKNVVEKVLSIPRNLWLVSPDDIRWETRDFPELNEIFRDLITDEGYERAIVMATLDYNRLPPYTTFTPNYFPDVWLLIKMALLEVMSNEILYHVRNRFTGTSAGVSVPIHEQYDGLIAMLDRMRPVVEERKMREKRRLNYANCWGRISHFNPFLALNDIFF